MSDLVSQNLNMIFKTPKGETVHALKDLNFTSYVKFKFIRNSSPLSLTNYINVTISKE